MPQPAPFLPLLLRAPLALGRPLLRAGAQGLQPALAAVLQRALVKSGLQQDLELLEGRCLALRIDDLGLSWRFTAGPGGLAVAPPGLAADATIAGDSAAFLLLASRQEDPDTLFFRRRLVISGDTALGLGVKNLLDALEPESLPWPARRLLQDLAWLQQRLAGSLIQQPPAPMPGPPRQ